MRKWWLTLGISILLLPVILLAIFLLAERWRGRVSLSRYDRMLLAKGEILEAGDSTRSITPGANGTPDVLAAQKELRKGAVLPEHCPPRMKLTPGGRAVVCFREAGWNEVNDAYRWEDLAADLKTNETTLARIRTALDDPVLVNQVDFALGPKMSFQHLSPAKSLAQWFGSGVQLALHEGRTREALTNLVSEIRLPRLLAQDRLVISELVRIAIAGIAGSGVSPGSIRPNVVIWRGSTGSC